MWLLLLGGVSLAIMAIMKFAKAKKSETKLEPPFGTQGSKRPHSYIIVVLVKKEKQLDKKQNDEKMDA